MTSPLPQHLQDEQRALEAEIREALKSVTREGGRTMVRVASDDNFMPVLRTVLLEFAFAEGDRAP